MQPEDHRAALHFQGPHNGIPDDAEQPTQGNRPACLYRSTPPFVLPVRLVGCLIWTLPLRLDGRKREFPNDISRIYNRSIRPLRWRKPMGDLGPMTMKTFEQL